MRGLQETETYVLSKLNAASLVPEICEDNERGLRKSHDVVG